MELWRDCSSANQLGPRYLLTPLMTFRPIYYKTQTPSQRCAGLCTFLPLPILPISPPTSISKSVTWVMLTSSHHLNRPGSWPPLRSQFPFSRCATTHRVPHLLILHFPGQLFPSWNYITNLLVFIVVFKRWGSFGPMVLGSMIKDHMGDDLLVMCWDNAEYLEWETGSKLEYVSCMASSSW